MLTSWLLKVKCYGRSQPCFFDLLRIFSTTNIPSLEKPNIYHLEHVRKRLEYTVPLMFRQRLDYTFYSPNVVCDDQILSVQKVGLDSFMRHVGMYAVALQFLCPHIEMEALSIVPMLEDGTVRLRWRVKHVTLWRALTNPLLFKYDYRIKKLHWFDGYSIFYVDGSGFVSKMTIQKTMPDDERLFTKKTATQKIAEKIGVLPKQAAADFSSLRTTANKFTSSMAAKVLLEGNAESEELKKELIL